MKKSKALQVSVSNINIYNTDGLSVMSCDVHIGVKSRHKVIAKTTQKLKQGLKTKIMEYCKNRQSRQK